MPHAHTPSPDGRVPSELVTPSSPDGQSRSPTKSNLTQLRDFIGYLSTVRGDLSNITAPPFVLSTKSVTELPATWAEHQSLFLSPATEPDPALRALAVLKNFLCSLKRQTYTGRSDAEGLKKPLNAFLGELFIARFGTEETHLISEQVAHHPPVTACFLWHEASGTYAEGCVAQNTTFSATHGVQVRQLGHALITLRLPDGEREGHLLTLPTLQIKSLLSGSPYPELAGSCALASSSGLTSRVDFTGKHAFGLAGVKNSLHAEVSDSSGTVLYEIEGQWTDTLTVYRVEHGKRHEMETIRVPDLKVDQAVPTASGAEQSPWETRCAWADTVRGIEEGDMRTTSAAKSRIEEGQRALRKQDADSGGDRERDFERLFFVRDGDEDEQDEMLKRLAKVVGLDLEEEREKTAGRWRFVGVEEATKRIKEGRARRGGVLPTGEREDSRAV